MRKIKVLLKTTGWLTHVIPIVVSLMVSVPQLFGQFSVTTQNRNVGVNASCQVEVALPDLFSRPPGTAMGGNVPYTVRVFRANQTTGMMIGGPVVISDPFRAGAQYTNGVLSFDACAVVPGGFQSGTSYNLIFQVVDNGGQVDGMGNLRIDFKGSNASLNNNLDTAVWCIDPILALDPNDLSDLNWYTADSPYTLLPTALLANGDDVVIGAVGSASFNQADLNQDGQISPEEARAWYRPRFESLDYRAYDDFVTFTCGDSDTTKVILREWEAYSQGVRTSVVDSIAVVRLPQITGSILHFPMMDTVRCAYDTTIASTVTTGESCWNDAVGMHTEADMNYVSYPILDVLTTVDNAAMNPDVASALQNIVIINPATGADQNIFDLASTIRSSIRDFLTDVYGDPSTELTNFINGDYAGTLVLISQNLGTAANYRLFANGSKIVYGYPYAIGDQFYSNGGSYITVTAEWNYEAGRPGGFPIQICLPRASATLDTIITDFWEGCPCENGPELVLPIAPGMDVSAVTDCAVLDSLTMKFCLSSVAAENAKCGVYIFDQSTGVQGSCPQMNIRRYTIKQTCYSAAITIPTIVGCEVDGSGIVNQMGTPPGEIRLDLEQWKIYLDELPPILDSIGPDVTVTLGTHCEANATVPAISFRDACSGVKFVRASVAGSTFYPLELGEDGLWRLPAGSTINFTAPGTYPVTYIVADSCHNRDTIMAGNVIVTDNTPPSIIFGGNNRTRTCGQDATWEDVNFEINNECGTACTFVRRVDWSEACEIELCDGRTFSSEAAMDDSLDAGILDRVLTGNNMTVEGYYRESYHAFEDGSALASCVAEDSIRDVLSANISAGWRNAIKQYWAANCAAAGITIADPTGYGGGWGDQIPVCDEDVCTGSITVQVLAIDNSGNVTISPPYTFDVTQSGGGNCSCGPNSVAGDVVEMTCGAYNELGVLDSINASTAPNFGPIDSLLGVPQRVELNAGGTGAMSPAASDSVQYLTMQTIFDTATAADGSDSLIVTWDTTQRSGRLPLYQAACELTFTQTIDMSGYTGCSGSVTRTWENQATTCPDGTVYTAGEITLVQTINISGDDPRIAIHETLDTVDACFRFSAAQYNRLLQDLSTNNQGSIRDTFLTNGQLVDVLGQIPRVNETAFAPPPLVTSTAPNSCITYEGAYDDGRVAAVPLLDTAGSGDTVGVIFLRIYEYTARCGGNTTTFPFNRDTSVLRIFTDTSASSTCLVLDNDPATRAQKDLTGTILSPFSQEPIGLVEVTASLSNGSTLTAMTDEQGEFQFDIPEGLSANIVPAKDINPKNGVDIFDVLFLHRHILGQAVIEDDMTRVAADVNNDGRINGVDVIIIQQLTLDKIESFPNNTSWRFFSKETGEENYHVYSNPTGMHLKFSGIKVGDLDKAGVDLSRSREMTPFHVSDDRIDAGQTKMVHITTDENLLAYQFTIRYDASAMEIVQIGAKGQGRTRWHKVREGEIRVSELAEGTNSLELVIEAKRSSDLKNIMTLTDSKSFANVVITERGDVQRAQLVFGEDQSFELFQNVPNPTGDKTIIGFLLPEDSKVSLKLFDISGKILSEYQGFYLEGLNQIELDAGALGVSGVVYYQLETPRHSATKKMVVLK